MKGQHHLLSIASIENSQRKHRKKKAPDWHVWACVWLPEKCPWACHTEAGGFRFPGDRVTEGFEVPNMHAGDQTPLFWRVESILKLSA